jgi:hypothetical protein
MYLGCSFSTFLRKEMTMTIKDLKDIINAIPATYDNDILLTDIGGNIDEVHDIGRIYRLKDRCMDLSEKCSYIDLRVMNIDGKSIVPSTDVAVAISRIKTK